MQTLPNTTPIESLDILNDEQDLNGWFCIMLAQERRCKQCGMLTRFIHSTDTQRIVVWPEKDHPKILENAARIMKRRPDYDPRIVEYEQSMGPAVPYSEAD